MRDPSTTAAAAAVPARGGVDAGTRSVARGGALNLVTAAVATVANLGLTLLVTRGFPPAAAGVFFAATSVFVVGQRVAGLGTQTGLVYFVSRLPRDGRGPASLSVLRLASRATLIASLLSAGAIVALGVGAPRLLVRGDPGALATHLVVLAIALPFAVAADQVLATTRGLGTMRPTAYAERLLRPLGQVALAGLAVLAGRAWALGLAWAVPFVLAMLLGGLLLRREVRRRPGDPAAVEGTPTRAAFWRFTAPRALHSMVQIGIQRADIVLVAALLGAAEAAVYTAATRFLVVGQMAGQAIGQAVEPQLGARLGRGDRTGAEALYRTSTCWLVLTTWPFYLVSAMVAPFVLRVFGTGYDQGAVVTVVLCLSMLVATASGTVDTMLNMAGRTSWTLGNAAAALVVNLVLNVLLLPRIGLLGAALAWMASLLMVNVLPLLQLAVSMRLHPFGRASLTAIGLATLTLGGPAAALGVVAPGRAGPTAVAAVVGLLAYLAGAWRLRERLELDALAAALRPGGRGSRG